MTFGPSASWQIQTACFREHWGHPKTSISLRGTVMVQLPKAADLANLLALGIMAQGDVTGEVSDQLRMTDIMNDS